MEKLCSALHVTKIYRQSKIHVIGQNHTDPLMFSSFCSLTWLRDKNTNQQIAVLFSQAVKYLSRSLKNLR